MSYRPAGPGSSDRGPRATIRTVRNPGQGDVVEALLDVERESLTGVLEIKSASVTTRVAVKRGVPCLVEAGTRGEALGRVLVRLGLLTDEQYAAVIQRMTDALFDNEHVRFGEVVVEYGFMTSADLTFALTEQVRQKLIACVVHGRAEWLFVADEARAEEVESYPIAIKPLLVDAAQEFPEKRVSELLQLQEDRYPELTVDIDTVVSQFELSPSEAQALLAFDGTRSVHVLLSRDSRTDTAALLAALVCAKTVELHAHPTGIRKNTSARPVPPEFLRAQAQAPAAVLVGELVPQRLPSRRASSRRMAAVKPPEPSAEARVRAGAALHRLMLERKHLAKRLGAGVREPKDEKERQLSAERAFHAGRAGVLEDDLKRALPELKRAHQLCPLEREYRLYMEWAQLRVDNAMADEKRRVELRRLATNLLREDSECELGYYVLGHCALQEGKDDFALRFFKKAFELDPKLVDAGRQLRLLTMRAASGNAKKNESKPDPSPPPKRGLLDTPLEEIVPALLRKLPAMVDVPGPIVPVSVGSADPITVPVDPVEPVPIDGPRRSSRPFTVALAASFALVAVVAYVAGARSSVDGPTSLGSDRVLPPTPSPPRADDNPAVIAPTAPALSASAIPAAPAATKGTVRMPARAKGRRVFIDDRVTGEGPGSFDVTCGVHRVRIGSRGVERTVSVPCGGSVEVE